MKPLPPMALAMAVAARKTFPISSNLVFLRELKRKYRYLYQEKVQALPDGSYCFQNARLFRRAKINVLFLKGDRFEMAFQHGRLLSEAIHRGVLAELHRIIPNIIHNSVTKIPWLNRLLTRGLDYLGNNVLLYNIAPEDLKDTFALSEGSGIALEAISGALLSVEALTILAKYAVSNNGIQIHPMAFSGCSSFAAWGENSASGELIIGRNLDYQLNGFFDAHPTVAYHEPTDGTQAYVSIGSAGLHTPSLTAFNQSGIYLAVHMVPTNETSFSGVPVFFASSEVIRKARTLDEAIAVFRRAHPTAGWSFVLASIHEKRVVSLEITYDGVAVRESEGQWHGQTNHFLSPDMVGANLFINKSIGADSAGRLLRMEEMAQEMPIDERRAVEILGDTWDPHAKRDLGLGSTLAVHITVGSSVFVPAQGKFYVASGMAPVSQNDYVEFPWLGLASRETFDKSRYGVLRGGKFRSSSPAMAEAVQKYIAAKVAYENRSEVETAYALMREVVELDPENAAYRFVLGIFALKIGDFEEGKRRFGEVLEINQTQHLHHLAYYYRGRVFAHQGDTDAAAQDFSRVIDATTVDQKLYAAARRARHRTKLMGSFNLPASRLPLLMQFADLLSY